MPNSNSDSVIRRFQSELRKTSSEAWLLEPTIRSCEDAIQRSGAGDSCAVTINIYHLRPKVCLLYMTEKLSNVVGLIRELAKDGIRQCDKKHQDWPVVEGVGIRRYQLTSSNDESVRLDVMLTGESCQTVQTGVKEVPIYEVRCEEATVE